MNTLKGLPLYDMQILDDVVKQVLLCGGQAGYAAACLLIEVHMIPPVSGFVTYFTVTCNGCQQMSGFVSFFDWFVSVLCKKQSFYVCVTRCIMFRGRYIRRRGLQKTGFAASRDFRFVFSRR